jgi:phenylalanyl-tRNA synthetase beta chain
MRISYKWLQDFVDVDILGVDVQEVSKALTMVGLAVETFEGLGDDHIFDVDITTNRPDCLNHMGVARELAAQFRLKLRKPDFSPIEYDKEGPSDFPARISIRDPDLCPRYAGRVITGVKVAESPDWLKKRLEAVGQRPINNLVDITNYVLFEVGHPLHAFDYELLEGREIVVRRARNGELLTTLDGSRRELDESMLMICDAKYPVAVGGVMGGENSEISDATRTILLESAYFNPASIRSTARKLNLVTEASYRFERGADPELPVKALNLACRLIVEICGGQCVSPVIDEYPRRDEERVLTLRKKRIEQVLGISVSDEDVIDILTGLEFQPVLQNEGSFRVRVPSFRRDIELEDDVVEEVARHYGYDRISSHYPPASKPGSYSETEGHERVIVQTLVDQGFYEAINYVFATPEKEGSFLGYSPSMIQIANPLTGVDTHLRTSLLPGLVNALRQNLNHGNRDVRLFEIGKVYRPKESDHGQGWLEEPRLALVATGEFYNPFWLPRPEEIRFEHLKGILQLVFAKLGLSIEFKPMVDSGYLHPGIGAGLYFGSESLGCVGQLQPRLSSTYKFQDPVYLADISLMKIYSLDLPEPRYTRLDRFPSVDRDLSFLLDREVPFSKIRMAAQALQIAELKNLRLSLTVRLTFAHPERTLTQDEVNERFERVVNVLQTEFAIEQR